MAKKLTTISHSTLANRMKEEENFFCLADTKEWYVYVDGCYTNEGSDVIMEKLIRDKYHDVFLEIVKSEQKARIEAGNEEVEESDGVSMDATQRLVGEVLHLLRAECHMSREELDKKNGINTLHLYSVKEFFAKF